MRDADLALKVVYHTGQAPVTQINEALRKKRCAYKKKCSLSFNSDEPGGGSLKQELRGS